MAVAEQSALSPSLRYAANSTQPVAVRETHDPRVNERLDWHFAYLKRLPIDAPRPSMFKRRLETGVNNGDCLPACFAALLECFHRGRISSPSLKTAARQMRLAVCAWIKENWHRFPVFNDSLKVHEIVRMLHDLGIPEQERQARGEWGEDASAQMRKYSELCERVYFSDVEMLMFSCMMWERRRLPILFRVFRVQEHPQNAFAWVGTYVTTTPEPEIFRRITGLEEALIVDVAHLGQTDAFHAHYKLLTESSLSGLTSCPTQTRPTRSPVARTAPLAMGRAPSDYAPSHGGIDYNLLPSQDERRRKRVRPRDSVYW